MDDKNNEIYKKAKKRVEDLKAFYSHLSSFIIVISGLAALNLLTSPQYLWFLWVVFGWGIGLAAHAMAVFGMGGIFGEDWENKKIQQYVEKNR